MELITYDQFKEACDKCKSIKGISFKTSAECMIFLAILSRLVDPKTIPQTFEPGFWCCSSCCNKETNK